jgi:hypothetical protein
MQEMWRRDTLAYPHVPLLSTTSIFSTPLLLQASFGPQKNTTNSKNSVFGNPITKASQHTCQWLQWPLQAIMRPSAWFGTCRATVAAAAETVEKFASKLHNMTRPPNAATTI